MTWTRTSLTFLLAFLVVLPPAVCADSYRCGRKIVRDGDSVADLLHICGDPLHREQARQYMTVDGRYRKVSVQRWYYQKSARSLEHVVVVHEGRIVSIDVADR